MLRPPAVRAGDRVALVAPAGPVSETRIRTGIRRARALGFDPVLGASARRRAGYLAGNDEERARDLQTALEDPSIAAVWALRGGYGVLRLLPLLDLEPLRGRPKAFIGFSDNTALHLALARREMVSFHGPHAGFRPFPPLARECLLRVLGRREPVGLLPPANTGAPARTLVPGSAEGPLTGGNLSLVAAACGTPYAPDARGRIVVLEDVDEPVYRIDRMLVQLLLAGALEGAAGLAFGRFTRIRGDHSERPLARVLAEFAATLGIPAACDLPFGHVAENWTLPLGCRARLDATAGTLELLEPAVA